MMLWGGIDRRSFPRAKYKCLIKIAHHGKEEVFSTYTENIGAGGICVVLGKEIDLFKTAKLTIYLAEKGEPIVCNGAIVWVIRRHPQTKSGTFEYDTGIEFIDISEDGKRKIAEMVDKLLEG